MIKHSNVQMILRELYIVNISQCLKSTKTCAKTQDFHSTAKMQAILALFVCVVLGITSAKTVVETDKELEELLQINDDVSQLKLQDSKPAYDEETMMRMKESKIEVS